MPLERAVRSATSKTTGSKAPSKARDSGAGDHGVALDHQFVDLGEESAREPAAAAEPDVQAGVFLLLELAHEGERVARDNGDVRADVGLEDA